MREVEYPSRGNRAGPCAKAGLRSSWEVVSLGKGQDWDQRYKARHEAACHATQAKTKGEDWG